MKKNKKKGKKFQIKRLVISLLLIFALLSFLIYVLVINISARRLDKYSEVTFITPNQAIVFWKSETPTLGYIKYGEKKFNKGEIELQTTSQPSEIHVVFLDRVPPEGMYIARYLESSNILIFPKSEFIIYKESDNIYEE